MQGKDPFAFWNAYQGCGEVAELANFTIRLLKVVVHQAGVDRLFSDLKIKQTQWRCHLKLEKLDKMAKVRYIYQTYID